MASTPLQLDALQQQLVEVNAKYLETLKQLETLRIEHQHLALEALSAQGQAFEAYEELQALKQRLLVDDQPWM